MIRSKSYTGLEGTDYIESNDLVLTDIYSVKRSGVGYDKNAPGDSSRMYIYHPALGRIYFQNEFNAGGEKVFVIFKQTSTTIGDIPGICNPVSIPSQSLKNGIVGRLYNSSLLVSGSSPISHNVDDKPAWAEVTFTIERVLQVTGIPDAAGVYNFEITFNNCGGPETINTSMTVYEATSNLNVATTGFTQRITNITGITYTIISGSFPVRQGTFPPTMDAVFDDYTGVINVSVSGITFPKTLYLYKNAVVQEAIPVPSNGTYTFASASYLSTDNLQIIL